MHILFSMYICDAYTVYSGVVYSDKSYLDADLSEAAEQCATQVKYSEKNSWKYNHRTESVINIYV